MPVNIIAFGQLADITGSLLSLDNITDTDDLVRQLNKLYPALANKKYVIAVDKRVVTINTILGNNNTVALLPPFSGG
jgi:sulfur-carrier protein